MFIANAEHAPIPHVRPSFAGRYLIWRWRQTFHYDLDASHMERNRTAQGSMPWAVGFPSIARKTRTDARLLWQRRGTLFTQPKSRDGDAISLHVLPGQICEKPAALSYELEETTSRVEIVPVRAQVICEAGDPLGQQRDLNLGRTGVIRMRLILRND